MKPLCNNRKKSFHFLLETSRVRENLLVSLLFFLALLFSKMDLLKSASHLGHNKSVSNDRLQREQAGIPPGLNTFCTGNAM